MKVSARYLDWAHGPAAESGNEAAEKVCELANGKKGRIEVPSELHDEVIDVAELYDGNDAVELFYRSEAARIVKTPEAAAWRAARRARRAATTTHRAGGEPI